MEDCNQEKLHFLIHTKATGRKSSFKLVTLCFLEERFTGHILYSLFYLSKLSKNIILKISDLT